MDPTLVVMKKEIESLRRRVEDLRVAKDKNGLDIVKVENRLEPIETVLKESLYNLSKKRFDSVQEHKGIYMRPGEGYGSERRGFPHQPGEHVLRQNRRSFRQPAKKGKSVRKTRTRRKGTKRKKQPR